MVNIGWWYRQYYTIIEVFFVLVSIGCGCIFGFFEPRNFSYNLRTREDIGNFDPGDTLGISFGMGVSLNERTSFSLGYSHRHVFNSSLDGNTIDGSSADVGQLLIGYSYKFAKQTLFNLSLGIGVTEDSPNLKLDFRVPMTFDVGAPW